MQDTEALKRVERRVSLVTATWNRALELPELFASLVHQGHHVREWIVVDDGSTDETVDVLSRLAGSAPFPVRVFRQANAGKHVAVNRGVREATGDFVGIIDSDDLLLPMALECLLKAFDDAQGSIAETLLGVTGRCITEDGSLVGPRQGIHVANWQEAHYVLRLRGERWGIQRRELLAASPFPAGAEERYVGESIVWRRLGLRNRTLYVDDPVRMYRSVSRERLTTVDFIAVARARRISHQAVLTNDWAYFRAAPLTFARSAIQWNRGRILEPNSSRVERRSLPTGARLLSLALWPAGRALATRDRRHEKARQR